MPAIYGGGNSNGESRVLHEKFGTTFENRLAKWTDPVLARNGMIYCCPAGAINASNQTRVLKINPERKTTELVGTVYSSVSWTGGAMGADGKIYFAPNTAAKVLEVDPNTDTTTLIGSDYGAPMYKWWGVVTAPNGKLYCMPRNDTHVLKIDPIAKTTQRIGSNLGSTEGKFMNAVLGSNGKIYSISTVLKTILEVDPSSDTTRLIYLPIASGEYFRANLTLGINGKIYSAPSVGSNSSNSILEFNPIDESFFLFGNNAALKSSCLTIGADGLLYSTPVGNNLYSIDVHTREIRFYNSTNYPIVTYYGDFRESVLAPNGKLYYPPFDSQRALEIDILPKPVDYQKFLKVL